MATVPATWLAVFYTSDGPYVAGPFESETAARLHICNDYRDRYGETLEEAADRYESSGNEWTTVLHAPEEY